MKDIQVLLKKIEHGDETEILGESNLTQKLDELLKNELVHLKNDRLHLTEKGLKFRNGSGFFSLPHIKPVETALPDTPDLSYLNTNSMRKRILKAYNRLTIQEKSMLTISILILAFLSYILSLEI
jgi:hypothetical protein